MATRTIETYENGVLVGTRTVTVPVAEVNADALQAKAMAALTANATYLAQPAIPAGTLTTAQLGAALRIVRAQTDLLTRENNAVIRLLLGELDDVGGT